MNKKLQILGLAQVAGQLVSGYDTVLQTLQQGKACLVVAASDLSPRSLKNIANKCSYYQVPLHREFDSLEISQALGKKRSICALTDQGFANSLK